MGGMTGCLALADGAGPDTDWVGRAAMRVAHRGPDDEGYFADPDLALAFRRLAVIDLSADVRQPMYSADGRYVLAFDGEIYNYIELAQRLGARGVQLRTRSAAEVLVEMYAWLGKDVVRQLRGMYAFAIWDRRTRELFCARDPFGIKPFFYALTAGGQRPRPGPQLRFASERKALADSGEVTAIDPDALRRYLSFQYVPAPATLVPPARALAAGARADRPPRRPRRRVPVLAARAPAGQVPLVGLAGEDPGRAARLGRGPPAQRCAGRRVPVRRGGFGHAVRAGRRVDSRPADLHRRIRARGVQRDRARDGRRRRRSA